MTSMFDYDDSVNLAFDAKIAGKKLVTAKHELLTKTGDFLFLAHSDKELAQRMQMVEADIEKVAYRKLANVSDSKAKLVRAIYDEWSIRHANCNFCKDASTKTAWGFNPISDLGQAISDIGSGAGKATQAVTNEVGKLPGQALNLTKDVAKGIGTGVKDVGTAATDVAKGIGTGVKDVGTAATDVAKGIGTGVKDVGTAATDVAKGIGTGVKDIVSPITNAVGSLYSQFEQGLQGDKSKPAGTSGKTGPGKEIGYQPDAAGTSASDVAAHQIADGRQKAPAAQNVPTFTTPVSSTPVSTVVSRPSTSPSTTLHNVAPATTSRNVTPAATTSTSTSTSAPSVPSTYTYAPTKPSNAPATTTTSTSTSAPSAPSVPSTYTYAPTQPSNAPATKTDSDGDGDDDSTVGTTGSKIARLSSFLKGSNDTNFTV